MKMITAIKIGVCLLLPLFGYSQYFPDSSFVVTDTLQNVTIRGFDYNKGRLINNAVTITKINIPVTNKTSLVQAFNTIPGVRMEERSPGSYRINIRGSSLRSPFGVRNVKVYWNGIPLTDAGGNTYFNQLAFNNFSTIHIYKGPAGSLYGAGTGGMLEIQNNWKNETNLEYMAGSYGLNNIFFDHSFGSDSNQNRMSYAHNESLGYRDHTRMRRGNASWISRIRLSDRHQIGAFALFTNLYYQTPGALTAAEFQKDPKAARPAAGSFPGSEQAKAAIYQTNILAGFTNDIRIAKQWKNNTMMYGSYANIKNPTVRNYEKRSEPNAGIRTSFEWEKKTSANKYRWVTGAEYQAGFFNTKVFTNVDGEAGSLQTDDDIHLQTGFLFTQLDFAWNYDWFLSAGASLNYNRVAITRENISPITEQRRKYANEFLPRISLLKKMGGSFSLNAIYSRGFSPATISELLPSTSIINTSLNAEHGNNYEFILQGNLNRLNFSIDAYHFALNDALVQRRDSSGADYFINAGGTNQDGVEINGNYLLIFHNSIFENFYANASYTYAHYRYKELSKDGIDYSGKTLPAVPSNTLALQGQLQLHNGIYVQLNAFVASSIFLNDANTVKADPYQVCGIKAGWKRKWHNQFITVLYAGIDNLANEQYSLGNDINDPRGRFYNLAAGRNFYLGLSFNFAHKKKS